MSDEFFVKDEGTTVLRLSVDTIEEFDEEVLSQIQDLFIKKQITVRTALGTLCQAMAHGIMQFDDNSLRKNYVAACMGTLLEYCRAIDEANKSGRPENTIPS